MSKYDGHTPERKIVVLSCGRCPLSRLMRLKDGPFCDHQATDGMSIAEYSDSIHPDCPLAIADAPMLAERVEYLEAGEEIYKNNLQAEEKLTHELRGHYSELEDSHAKLAEQNAKMLAELKL